MALRRSSPITLASLLASLLAASPGALAQTTPSDTPAVPRPGAVETAPLAPPPATMTPGGTTPAAPAQAQPTTPEPSPPQSATPATPPAPAPSTAQPVPPPAAPTSSTAQPAAPPAAPGIRQSLVPTPGDPNDVDEVTLPARPVAVLSGRSTWDEGFAQLKSAFARIEAALKPLGIAPAGRPVALFVETDDMGFRYEAMVPTDRPLDGSPAANPEIRPGTTPSGRALRFVHEAPYDDIDTTYETITAYLDAKGVNVRDTFIEEYVGDLTEAGDPNLRINIFVQPR